MVARCWVDAICASRLCRTASSIFPSVAVGNITVSSDQGEAWPHSARNIFRKQSRSGQQLVGAGGRGHRTEELQHAKCEDRPIKFFGVTAQRVLVPAKAFELLYSL